MSEERAAPVAGRVFYWYMSRAEVKAVERTGLLRGGRPGRTYWTDEHHERAEEAQSELALKVGQLLVGRRVEISVGEPWDFKSPDGQNSLRGEIVAVRENPEAPHGQEVLLAVTPFLAEKDRKIDRLRARTRYEEESGIVERLAKGEDAEVNLDYSDQVPERERDPNSLPFLIGGLHIVRGALETNDSGSTEWG